MTTSNTIPRKTATRNLALLGLLAAPWVGFLALALKPSPRKMWAQRWPTLTFVGMYQLALDQCVEIQGLEHIPTNGSVILAGNHINRSASEAMLMGSKILVERGRLAKFVSQANPPDPMLKRFVRLMGDAQGVLLPIRTGMTTENMVRFLRDPHAFGREQAILGIFPAGSADRDFQKQMDRPWHTSAAVAATETGSPIVPFYVEGLPYEWGPLEMLKAASLSIVGGKAFNVKIRFAPPIRPVPGETDYASIIQRVREAVLRLAG